MLLKVFLNNYRGFQNINLLGRPQHKRCCFKQILCSIFIKLGIQIFCSQALFDDDEVANSLESLAGTLKAAKRRDMNILLVYEIYNIFTESAWYL